MTPLGARVQNGRLRLDQPAKGSALDIPAEPGLVASVFLARSARLGPLCGQAQRVQNSRFGPHSGPTELPEGTELDLVIDDEGNDLTEHERRVLHDTL